MEMSKEEQKRFETLTPKERLYFSIMNAKSGVLMIKSKPGVAKSAIARSIAKKMGYAYKDIRLTLIDETDVGLYPDKSIMNVDGVDIKVLDFIVPRWAVEASLKPTIIHFEELNRASLQVRNAALQILLEREIGTDFKFGNNVLMMSSGNLGEEDNTDVEEFDSALNNRLIHVNHSLTAKEWIDGFAKDNVHPVILDYLTAHGDQLYKSDSNSPAYATPRSWTFLSDFIIKTYGKKSTTSDFLPVVTEIAPSYIGATAQKFIRYCRDQVNLSIDDIINNFDKVKDQVIKFNRDRRSELLQALKPINLNELNDKQMKNIVGFLNTVDDDEKTSYILNIIDNPDQRYNFDDKKMINFLIEFKECFGSMKEITDTRKLK